MHFWQLVKQPDINSGNYLTRLTGEINPAKGHLNKHETKNMVNEFFNSGAFTG